LDVAAPVSLLELGPARASFEVPALTCSGLRVRYVRLAPPPPAGPAPLRWVRYVTHSDDYVMRM
ncbi:AP4M1 protein, partial [Eudromia elegans]|nr:AP4M1 protein [Eudromia elegans]